MHDHYFIENIIKQVPNKNKVISIEIELGDLAEIDAGHLKEHLTSHTSWKVEVKVIPSKIKCLCGYIGEARVLQRLHDLVIYDCPECSHEPDIVEGKDIKITKVIYR
ncbi:MAG: hydrogenase/urease maturation nickel metallochaperone HypA [Nanoarchaeota archaeon]|nr:hydrogenase/urease maturation nickel metallochaperone HypA [Nanoarchaeota archaeon]